jgi:DNA-binding NarL/FixJ family response regulator
MDMRCLIVDDNDRFLETARGVLKRDGIPVVGVASDGTEALEKAGSLRPDVVLVDVCLGEECGVDLAGRLVEEAPDHPIVILISTYPEDDFADIVASSAAFGFLPKSELSGAAIRGMVADAVGRTPARHGNPPALGH